MTYANIKPDTESLLGMLETCRPAGSKSERKFIARYLTPLGLIADRAGNLSKRIGESKVLWSCHTDTVHWKGGTQRLAIKDAILTLDSKSNCLGADDTAGVWLMREMILAQIPGLYVFHRAEEQGGIGSRFIAESTPDFLNGIDYAIALDRKGVNDVITHQMHGRCCSDSFAAELAARLGNGYTPSKNGIFTDTANYTSLIPECTNISVGYQHEHSSNESLNLEHLLMLRHRLVNLDTTGLPVARDPNEIGYDTDWHKYDSFGFEPLKQERPTLEMVDMIRDNPEIIASILDDYGIDKEELCSEIYSRGGIVRF